LRKVILSDIPITFHLPSFCQQFFRLLSTFYHFTNKFLTLKNLVSLVAHWSLFSVAPFGFKKKERKQDPIDKEFE